MATLAELWQQALARRNTPMSEYMRVSGIEPEPNQGTDYTWDGGVRQGELNRGLEDYRNDLNALLLPNGYFSLTGQERDTNRYPGGTLESVKSVLRQMNPGIEFFDDPNFGPVARLPGGGEPSVPYINQGGLDLSKIVPLAVLAMATAGASNMGAFAGLGEAPAAGAGAFDFAAADAAGLAQMGADAGLSGGALDSFVASGGALGSTAAGGGGVAGGLQLTGGPLENVVGNTNFSLSDYEATQMADDALIGQLGTQAGNVLPDPSLLQSAVDAGIPFDLATAASNSSLKTAVDAIRAGNSVASVVQGLSGSSNKGTGISDALSRVLSGNPTDSDLVKLGLTAAGAAALFAENPDRTQTTKIEYPDWYNAGSKSALALADKFAALGPESVAPLSANETAAGSLAATSTGNWQPNLTRSGTLADEAAGGIPSIDLSAYMNPYLDNVLTPILRRNEIAKASTLNDINAKAGMRGAFGGSRNDLLTNLASESADRNMNEAEANIRSGAFTTGLNTAQSDLNRKLTAAGQFSNLGTATGALTGQDVDRLSSTGTTSRAVEQAKRNAPLTAISGYANALRGAPTTTTTVLPEASKVGQATGALAALLGANKAGWL